MRPRLATPISRSVAFSTAQLAQRVLSFVIVVPQPRQIVGFKPGDDHVMLWVDIPPRP